MASWKAGLSRYLSCLRFFACPESPSSKGVLKYYRHNYEELKLLNPNMPLMVRTCENAMPAVTAELDWTVHHVLQFMIQTGRFRNENGSLAGDRIDAAKAYLKFDWDQMLVERFKARPGFDPESPFVHKLQPDLHESKAFQNEFATYLSMKAHVTELETIFKGGPNDEFFRAENALLMCQRVDLWCAGEAEVERAVIHLYKLGRALNERETILPTFITKFVPGSDDIQDN